MHPSSSVSLLKRAALPAFLVTDLTNIRYLAGVEVSVGALLIRARGMELFIDGRYGEAAAAQVRSGIAVRERDALSDALSRVRRCGCEADAVTLARRDRWKTHFKNTKFVHKSGMVEWFRRSKDFEELRAFRKAQRITGHLLTRVPSLLRTGCSEKELAEKLRRLAADLGADELAFPSIVAFGTHTSRPHHQPTSRRLKKGEMVQIDIGARCDGYCADQSRVFFTGRKTEEQEKVLAAVQEAKNSASRMVRQGVSTHALDRAARAVLRHHGFEKYFAHSLGHGVGLEIHEGVTLSEKRPVEKLFRHEIITIEPGVYLPGKFGIRLEDEIIVGGEI